jgi:hypothetical protein
MDAYNGIKSHLRTEKPSNNLQKKPPPRITNEHVLFSNDKNEAFPENENSRAWMLSRNDFLVGMI